MTFPRSAAQAPLLVAWTIVRFGAFTRSQYTVLRTMAKQANIYALLFDSAIQRYTWLPTRGSQLHECVLYGGMPLTVVRGEGVGRAAPCMHGQIGWLVGACLLPRAAVWHVA